MLPGAEPTLADVVSVSIECADCGRNRWKKPIELRRFGVNLSTKLSNLGSRLVCSGCREDGMPGKNIVIQAAFVTDLDRLRAEASAVRNRTARAAG